MYTEYMSRLYGNGALDSRRACWRSLETPLASLAAFASRVVEAAGVENEIAAFGNFLTTHDF